MCYNKYMNDNDNTMNLIHISDIQLLVERLGMKDLTELVEHPDLPETVREALDQEIEDRRDDW